MPTTQEIAALISKSQINAAYAGDNGHETVAVSQFLKLLEKDIQTGRNISPIPEGLSQSLLARLGKQVDLDEDIEGDVVL